MAQFWADSQSPQKHWEIGTNVLKMQNRGNPKPLKGYESKYLFIYLFHLSIVCLMIDIDRNMSPTKDMKISEAQPTNGLHLGTLKEASDIAKYFLKAYRPEKFTQVFYFTKTCLNIIWKQQVDGVYGISKVLIL